MEKFKAITDGYDADDKRAVADARAKLATAFKAKAKSVNEKYIVPPKTTDFAIVYAPTESLYKELTEYQDPSTKELLTQELMKKHKVVICGPNTLSAYLQSLHMGPYVMIVSMLKECWVHRLQLYVFSLILELIIL